MVIGSSAESTHYIPVVCAIIEQGDSFLAACRRKHQTNGGLWEFPGGKVKKSESLEEALARELNEELGVQVEIGRQLSAVSWNYPWIDITLYPFITRLAGDCMPHPIDHAALRYVTREEAETLEWAPADRMILDEYNLSLDICSLDG